MGTYVSSLCIFSGADLVGKRLQRVSISHEERPRCYKKSAVVSLWDCLRLRTRIPQVPTSTFAHACFPHPHFLSTSVNPSNRSSPLQLASLPYSDCPDRVHGPSEPGLNFRPKFVRYLGPVSMDMRDSDDHVQEHGHQRQTQYVYGRSFGARMFGAVMDRLKGLETSVNMSTFGRVFRLDGSGHVCQNPRPYDCQIHPSCPLVLTDYSLASHIARPNTGCQLLHRDPCWADDVCDNGVHYRCKCTYVGAKVCRKFGVWKSYRLLTPVSQADILSETGGTCVCEKPLTSGGKCQNESQWSSCSAGKKTSSLV